MYKVASEGIIIGFITLLLGRIIMGLFIKNKNKKHPKGLNIAFFSTGFLLHFEIRIYRPLANNSFGILNLF